uniref:Uncharacterized protein n=1 Tax=Branchiostoma floridae TaxID=7739 RepID=C3ZXM0_BRAFL|eukprot:XP_002586672.1 hypothetical protein BRAFLDRAFT_105478 [Branchiostoma floridae]
MPDADKTAAIVALAQHGVNIKEFADTLVDRNVLEKYGLAKAPNRTDNADETGVSLDPQKKKIVTFKSMSGAASSVRPGSRDHITVLECSSAVSNTIPTLMIFSKNFPSSAYKLDGPPNAPYASTASGFIEGLVFLIWLKSGFNRFSSQERPVLLLALHTYHNRSPPICC